MSSSHGGSLSVGRILAEDQLGRLQTTSFTSPSLNNCGSAFCYNDSGGGVPGAAANLNEMGLASSQGRFRRTWNVSTIQPDVKQISVRVLWTDAPGGPSSAAPNSFNRRIELRSVKVNSNP